MPRKRLYGCDWQRKRKKVWVRDGGKCVRCGEEISLDSAHIDHIVSGKRGTNHIVNLRTLCPLCHATRGDYRHRGLVEKAIIEGILPPVGWRELLWWDDQSIIETP